jgi:hypothetical protein
MIEAGMMRIALAFALLAAALAPLEAAAQGRGPVRQLPQPRFGEFRDWLVACDNRRDCRAIGFGNRNGTANGALVIDREAEAEAAPTLSLHLGSLGDAATEVRDGMAIEVTSDDAGLGRLVVGEGIAVQDEERVRFAILDDAVGQAILGAMRGGRRLRFAVPGRDQPFEISLDGASAALLFMDDRQRRVGTVTALARRGDQPASAVPQPPPLPQPPQLAADPAWQPTPQRVTPPVRQRVLAERPADCSDQSDPPETTAIGRVGADLVLIQVQCRQGAYNASYHFHLWNDRTGRVTPLAFPVPEGIAGGAPPAFLTNPEFEASSLTLTHFSKGRGLGDCGSSGSWRWDGRAFALIRFDHMPECQGLMPGDWLTLHRSR